MEIMESNKSEQWDLNQLFQRHADWDEETRSLLTGMVEQLQQLEAENKRLRKALLSLQAKTPRMSTKLRDALYE